MPNTVKYTFSLSINNINREQVEELHFLGQTFDTNLNLEKKSNKCSKIIGTLNILKHVLPIEIIIILYNTLISSLILTIVSWR